MIEVLWSQTKTFAKHYLLRKLKSFNVSPHILESVYRSLIESILAFSIATWYGNPPVKLSSIVSITSKIVGSRQLQLYHLYWSGFCQKENPSNCQ